jgi:hypothetical protein
MRHEGANLTLNLSMPLEKLLVVLRHDVNLQEVAVRLEKVNFGEQVCDWRASRHDIVYNFGCKRKLLAEDSDMSAGYAMG